MNGRDSLLATVGDVSALAAALRAALDDETRRTELVAAGRERAGQFSMDLLADLYLERYERILTRP